MRPELPGGRRESPWRLGGLSGRDLAGRVWSELGRDEVTDRAAALSSRLLTYVNSVLPAEAARTVSRTLTEILHGNRGGLLSLGAVLALWAGSNGMASVIAALNVAYDVDEWRPWWKRRLLAVVLTVVFSLFIVTTLTLVVFGPRLADVVGAWLGLGRPFEVGWSLVSLPLVLVCGVIGVSLVYHLAPAVRMRWRWITPGAVLALGLWLAASYGLRVYVQYFGRYSVTYGSIGGVILLMLWLYLTSLALLIGAEVDAEIEHGARERGATTATDGENTDAA